MRWMQDAGFTDVAELERTAVVQIDVETDEVHVARPEELRRGIIGKRAETFRVLRLGNLDQFLDERRDFPRPAPSRDVRRRCRQPLHQALQLVVDHVSDVSFVSLDRARLRFVQQCLQAVQV